MFPLLETLKIEEGIPCHLEWHQRRMDYAFHMLFGSNNPMQLADLITVPKSYEGGILKCRFLYNSRDFEIEYSEHTPRQVSTLKLVHCDSIDYTHKYTNRNMIESLLEQKIQADDILIVRDGLITDTSYHNIVFFDGKQWLTPEEPLLEGTARNRLLSEGKIGTAHIRAEDLHHFKTFRLINALIDFESDKERSVRNIYS